MRTVAMIAAALAVAACGEDGVVVTATPQGVPADGMSLVEVTAEVTSIGEPAEDGTTVSFQASEAALFATPEAAQPAVAGARPVGNRVLEATVRGGRAVVYLLAPVEAGNVTVNGRFQHEDELSLGGEVVVGFTHPPLVAGGRFAGEGLGAVEPLFAFECGSHNIGAFVDNRSAIGVACSAVTQSPSGRDLPHAQVLVFAEAGQLVRLPATADAPPGVAYFVNAVPIKLPVDVAPAEWEQDIAIEGAGLIPGAVEQNPRDGLVTLLAVVRGQEAFLDANGDGTWNPGEPFVDEGEPFLDVDDDGVYTPEIDGQHCCDNNANGKVDGPNGTWDQDVWLGRSAHIVWSGPVSEATGRSGIAVDPPAIAADSDAAMTIVVVDANYNPVAMNGSSDGIALTPTGPLRFFPPPDFELPGGTGLDILDRYPFHVFDGTSAVADGLVIDNVRAWSATLEDDRDNQCVEEDWSMTAVVTATGAAGGNPEQVTLVSHGILATGEACP
jgi:hypothetical protein